LTRTASHKITANVMFITSQSYTNDIRQPMFQDTIVRLTLNNVLYYAILSLIGVDPARVRGSGPSWNFASEGPPLFGPLQKVWSTVMKHS